MVYECFPPAKKPFSMKSLRASIAACNLRVGSPLTWIFVEWYRTRLDTLCVVIRIYWRQNVTVEPTMWTCLNILKHLRSQLAAEQTGLHCLAQNLPPNSCSMLSSWCMMCQLSGTCTTCYDEYHMLAAIWRCRSLFWTCGVWICFYISA